MPAVLNSLQNQEFKIGYKKAYSDLAQAAAEGVAFGEFPYRNVKRSNEIALEEWGILKNKFGISKVCENDNAFDCWVDADRICSGACTGQNGGIGGPSNSMYSFIDLQGRAWGLFIRSENIYIVDTNGDRGPNYFGKDRWIFTFAGENGYRICGDTNCTYPGIPQRVIPYFPYDITTDSDWCHHPTCHYKSWLLE